MNESRKLFGTDGIRGVAGVPPLDPETIVKLGRAIARLFSDQKGRHKILIGKDTRLSGYMIETALAAGITAEGVNVELVGPVPTPAVSYLTRSMRVDAGVMISASHNPFRDNGIKLFAADGNKLPDSKEAELEALLDEIQGKVPEDEQIEIGKAHRIDDAAGRYIVYLKNCFPHELMLDGLRIGFDCANGSAYHIAPQLCEELGADVVARGTSPNGKNINSGFGSLYPEVVRELVLERNLDLGISLDGDADRAILIDEKGSTVDGDMVLAICAKYMKEEGLLTSDKIVATVMSNLGLERFLANEGLELVRTAVGDRYVLEGLEKHGANIGGEQSGHTIFSDHSRTGDGLLTTLKVLEVMIRRGKKLSELVEDFVRYPQKLINIKVNSKPELDTIDTIRDTISQKESELGDSGRILVRYSGTEPRVRVMVECEDEALCKKHTEEIAEVIEKEIGAV